MLNIALQSLIRPREGARAIFSWPVEKPDLMKIAALIAVISGIADVVSRMFMPEMAEGQSMSASPLWIAAFQFVGIVLVALLLDRIGRMLGGHGDFAGALKASIWFAFAWIIGIAVIILTLVLVPPLAPIIQLGIMVWMLIAFTLFVQELHGFRNFFATFAGVFGVGFVFGMVVLMVAVSTGLLPTEAV